MIVGAFAFLEILRGTVLGASTRAGEARAEELSAQVEAPEHQALVGGVELRHPLRGLEDHRVALDEPALVAEASPVMTFAGQLGSGLGRLVELDVHPVDERDESQRLGLIRQHLHVSQTHEVETGDDTEVPRGVHSSEMADDIAEGVVGVTTGFDASARIWARLRRAKTTASSPCREISRA